MGARGTGEAGVLTGAVSAADEERVSVARAAAPARERSALRREIEWGMPLISESDAGWQARGEVEREERCVCGGRDFCA